MTFISLRKHEDLARSSGKAPSMIHSKHKKKTEVNRQSLAAKIDAMLLYGTFALLMFGPLAFGAVEPWSIFCIEIGSAVLVLLWLARQWLNDEITIHWNPLFLPMMAFAVLIVVQIIFGFSAYR